MKHKLSPILFLLISAVSGWQCDLKDVEQPGNLVPPTAAEDPNLPQLRVQVAGHERALHLQTFGNASNPVAFVLHGGPGDDFKLLLPLSALSDRYFVVMWDQRGAGLSERIPKEELYIESFVEEIEAVRKSITPNQPVTLIGHSHGGILSARYAAKYPQNVSQLILLEPGALSAEGRKHYNGGAISFYDGQQFFWQNEVLSSSDHAAADYKAISLLPRAYRNFTCNNTPQAAPMWRFGAYHYYILQFTDAGGGNDYTWMDDLKQYTSDILLVSGTCGAASQDFQQYNIKALPARTQTEIIEGAGHLSLFLGYQEQLLQVLRKHLSAYR